MFRALTPVVKNLLLINVGFFLVTSYFLPHLRGVFALYYIESNLFMPFQLLWPDCQRAIDKFRSPAKKEEITIINILLICP